MLKKLSIITFICLMLASCSSTNVANSTDKTKSKPKQAQQKPLVKKGNGVIAPINAATGEFELCNVIGLEGDKDVAGKPVDEDYIEVARDSDKSKKFIVNIYEVIGDIEDRSQPDVKVDDIVLIPVDNPEYFSMGGGFVYLAAKVVSNGSGINNDFDIKVKPLQPNMIGSKYTPDTQLESVDGEAAGVKLYKPKQWYIPTAASVEKIQAAK